MRRILKITGLFIFLLILGLVSKTFFLHSKQIEVTRASLPSIDNKCIDRLKGAIVIPTISYDDSTKIDATTFTKLHKYIGKTFPLIHQKLVKMIFNRYSLMYTWKGKNSSLAPILLLAHQDVVPADSRVWKYAPFSGYNDGSYLWGRGTLDNKGSMISIMEAVEMLLKEGYTPNRTIILAFGNDEEIGGNGARKMARWLKEKRVKAELVLDEGLVVTHGMVPLVSKPVALIGTSEKGYASVELSCKAEGGHASTPPKMTAITILDRAINRVLRKAPHSMIAKPVNDFLNYLGPEVPWPARILFANRWLFDPLIIRIYKKTPSGNALVSTTAAPTIFQSGEKENMLPVSARAVINFRLLPGDTPGLILDRVRRSIHDHRVSARLIGKGGSASPVSPVNTDAFNLIHRTIRQTFDNTLVMPALMLALSDSRSYAGVSDNIYRFAPYQMGNKDMERIHGNNERIYIADYKKMIEFYYLLIRNSK
ncbi:MAG: M20 family peptidase [Bacteroidota bacterium]|nr:M20 family peptidase [Bacteroidota bacterium]